MSEIEIDKLLNNILQKAGINESSFNSIIVSGERGALPHGMPSERKIKDHD
jgi:Xaa-Pro aminopeptidase